MTASSENAGTSIFRRRVLSSGFTFLGKYLFPTLWILGFGAGTIASTVATLHGDKDAPPPGLFFLFLLIGGAFLYYFCARIKRVETDNRSLFISNYFEEIKVPLSNLEAVSENRWINQRPITIKFRTPTTFGKSVMFVPPTRLFRFWKANPLVAELRQLAGINYQEPVPLVPLGATAARIPGSNWIATRLASWDKGNPKSFIIVNLVLGLLTGLSNSMIFFIDASRDRISPSLIMFTKGVTLPMCGLLVLSALFGLAQPDTRRAVLRVHGLLLGVVALLLMGWMAEISWGGIPEHTSFSWSPGLPELSVCYAMFLFTRYTLGDSLQRKPFIFYLPAWILLPVIALDAGVLLSFVGMMEARFFCPSASCSFDPGPAR